MIGTLLLAAGSIGQIPEDDSDSQHHYHMWHQNEHHPHVAPKHPHHSLLTHALLGDEEKCKQLLRKGIPVDFQHDDQGMTALQYAAMQGTPGTVELLLYWGANVEHGDYEGKTALMNAVEKHRPEIIKILLEAGANPHRKATHGVEGGMTAADIAEQRKCAECKTILTDPAILKEHDHAVRRERHRAEHKLRSAMSHYTSYFWHAWAYFFTQSGHPGDPCQLYRAVHHAHGAHVNPELIAEAEELFKPFEKHLLHLLERRYICDDVANNLAKYKLTSLKDLEKFKGHDNLPGLKQATGLGWEASHLLQRALKYEVIFHDREARRRAHFAKEKEEKDEIRRMAEEEDGATKAPCDRPGAKC